MNDMMTFPDTWEEYEKLYGFNDSEEIYTNNSRLIPSFRVKQWLEHLPSAEPQIIQCKDCRWWTNQSTTLQGKCKLHGLNPMPEWYCASGEVSK